MYSRNTSPFRTKLSNYDYSTLHPGKISDRHALTYDDWYYIFVGNIQCEESELELFCIFTFVDFYAKVQQSAHTHTKNNKKMHKSCILCNQLKCKKKNRLSWMLKLKLLFEVLMLIIPVNRYIRTCHSNTGSQKNVEYIYTKSLNTHPAGEIIIQDEHSSTPILHTPVPFSPT